MGHTFRALAMDAVQKENCGHADTPTEQLSRFRQLRSETPRHPEFGWMSGVQTTTGPHGQGLANAVGLALVDRPLAAEFNRPEFPIVDHRTYVFAGDGCRMEGTSHRASLAGTWQLGELVVAYDVNGISIDGEVKHWIADDTAARFCAYGLDVAGPARSRRRCGHKGSIASVDRRRWPTCKSLRVDGREPGRDRSGRCFPREQEMKIRVAINGNGRIGRSILRALHESGTKHDTQIVAVNGLGDTKVNAPLALRDTAHGKFPGTVAVDTSSRNVSGDRIKVLSNRDPSQLSWKVLGVDMVHERTGSFTGAWSCRS